MGLNMNYHFFLEGYQSHCHIPDYIRSNNSQIPVDIFLRCYFDLFLKLSIEIADYPHNPPSFNFKNIKRLFLSSSPFFIS